MNNEKVLLDADFSNCFDSLHCDNGEKIFKYIFSQIGKKPCINYYVYNYELKYNRLIQKLVADGYIEVIYLTDITGDDELATIAYSKNISSMYSYANSEDLPEFFDVENFSQSSKNLGEIHSIATALLLGIELFCSNDKDSKNLVDEFVYGSQKLVVKNMKEVLEMVPGLERQVKRGLTPNSKRR